MATDNEVVDRGDNWEPTEVDTTAADAAAAAAAETAAAEAAAAAAAAETAAAAAKTAAAKEEGTDEEKAAAKAAEEAEAAKKGKDTRIPAARHKEILEKERGRREALEAENAALRKGQVAAVTSADIKAKEGELTKLEEQHAQFTLDGKTAEAAAAMKAIRVLERSIVQAQSDERIAAAEVRAVERVRYDMACDRIEAAYPQLNEAHEDFDAEKSKEVVELQNAYQLTGLTATQALQKAVKLLMPPETAKQTTATEVTPKVPAGAKPDAAAVEKARKKAEAEAAAAAIGKTPASTAKVGADSDKAGGGTKTAADVMKMSQKDFSALSDADLARMRGDEFAGA